MSLNFGFALPALAPNGAGGNNPFGQLGPTLDLSFADTVTDVANPTSYTLNTNFITPQYQIAAQYTIWELNVGLVAKTFGEIITYTRAGNATYFDATGTLQTAGANVPRFDYNPSTLAALGLLIEEQRTNSIRNNTMQGAVAGTPGTVPTNWQTFTALTGLTREIVGTGTESGITYIDIRLSGTPSAAGAYTIHEETITATAALAGQVWTNSAYINLQAGSATNGITSIANSLTEYSAASAFLTQSSTIFSPTISALRTQRYATTRTLTNASTAYVRPQIIINLDGGAIDLTLRIGLPQLENNNISTGVTSATVAAGGTGYTNGDTLTVVGGTGTAAALTVTGVSAGVITTVSVTTAGSYSVFPTSPASVTGGTGSAATFNLTPVAQTGFATSVIPTTTTALTRSADVASVNTLSPWFNATEGSIYFEGTTNNPVAANFPYGVSFNNGTINNRIAILRNNGTTQSRTGVVNGGATQWATDFGSWPLSSVVKTALAYKASDFAASNGGAAAVTQASGTVPSVSALNLGHQLSATLLNGYIRRITYYPRRLSNAELQAITA